MIKKLDKQEYKKAIELAKKVFDEYVSKDYSVEGQEEFEKFISDAEKIESLDMWGYFVETSNLECGLVEM